IEVCADVGHLPLDFRMHRRRILPRLDHFSNWSEDESRRVLKSLMFQLPYPIHQDITRTQSSSDDSSRASAAGHRNRFAYVADNHAIEPPTESAEAGMPRGRLKCGLEHLSVEPQLISGVQKAAFRMNRVEQGSRSWIHGL